jgi:hypothetical protein
MAPAEFELVTQGDVERTDPSDWVVSALPTLPDQAG